MRHLYSNQCHDESEVWCEKRRYYVDDGEATGDPESATCMACLEAARQFGIRAARRIVDINLTGVESASPLLIKDPR